MKRRTVLTGALATSVSLAGCVRSLGRTNSPDDESTTHTSTSGETTVRDDTSTTPTVNETDYPVTSQLDLRQSAFESGETPQVVVVSSDDWRERLRESILTDQTTSFLTETDFTSETVVAVSARVSAGRNRLVLESVRGVGTSTVRLRISEYESGSGLNNAPLHLLLVRVPNRGTEPTKTTARLDLVGGVETISTTE